MSESLLFLFVSLGCIGIANAQASHMCMYAGSYSSPFSTCLIQPYSPKQVLLHSRTSPIRSSGHMTHDLTHGRQCATSMPYFLVCKAMCEFEDGWAAFRFMATCRSARDAARFIDGSLCRAGRALLDMCHYLREERPFLPGFEPDDELAVALQPLTTWDPPCHASILIDPPPFMLEHFQYGSQGNMKAWIQCSPGFRGLDPLGALRTMNLAFQQSAPFQEFLAALEQGGARFFYSPIVYEPNKPMEARTRACHSPPPRESTCGAVLSIHGTTLPDNAVLAMAQGRRCPA